MYLYKTKICETIKEIEYLSPEKEHPFSKEEKDFFINLYNEMLLQKDTSDNIVKTIVVSKIFNRQDVSDISYLIYSMNIINHKDRDVYEDQEDKNSNTQKCKHTKYYALNETFYYVMPSGELIEYIHGLFSPTSTYWMTNTGMVFKAIFPIKNNLLLKNKLENSLIENNLIDITKNKI